MTRQNTIPSEDKSSMISALIPLWDFCNHTSGNVSFNPIILFISISDPSFSFIGS